MNKLNEMPQVTLKGAILVVGSLFWENEKNAVKAELGKMREHWRNDLLDLDNTKQVDVPIRYGRKSISRHNIYTKIFSTSVPVNGSALLVPIKNGISVSADDFSNLMTHAAHLAKVEGIAGDIERLCCNWGSVALGMTEHFRTTFPLLYSKMKDFWASQFPQQVNHSRYCIGSEKPCITHEGLVNFAITNTEDIDFFLCTPVVPNIENYPSPKEIADCIKDANYDIYLRNNIQNGISTFQDKDVLTLLT